jgi:hypothetical protein
MHVLTESWSMVAPSYGLLMAGRDFIATEPFSKFSIFFVLCVAIEFINHSSFVFLLL